MIFNSNTTYLNDVTPMAEGYDSGIGAAQALIEGVRNDYEMFKAMLGIDAKELQIRNESAGAIDEAQITALQESAAGSIWKKIAEFFKKFAAKIKGIWHTFLSKINGLFMKDKDMVRKYEKELVRKSNLGNMEIKVCNPKKKPLDNAESDINDMATDFSGFSSSSMSGKTWNSESGERLKQFLTIGSTGYDSESDFEEDYNDDVFDDESTEQLKDTSYGSIRNVIMYLKDASKKINKVETAIKKMTTKLDKMVTEANKKADEIAKQSTLPDTDSNHKTDTDVENANHTYDMAVAYQTASLCKSRCIMNAVKKDYKQQKMIFMKAIAANDKKLEESTFIDAYAEAAANEVTDVLDRALSNEELSKINVASKNVIDPDVSDDPGKLTYQPDSYFPNKSYVSASGSVDTDINSKSESAMFGELLY